MLLICFPAYPYLPPLRDPASFLANVISGWEVQDNQSSGTESSDLQVAKIISSSFSMKHKMGLVEITLASASVDAIRYYISSPSAVADANYTWYSAKQAVYASKTYSSTSPNKVPYEHSTYSYFYVTDRTGSTQFTATDELASGRDAGNNWTQEVTNSTIADGKYLSLTKTPTTTYLQRTGYTLALGDVFYSDGSVSKPNAKYTSKTVIGIVAYIGRDTYTEKDYGGGHALVMSKFEDSSTRQWKTSNTESDLPNIGSTMASVIADASGYYNCHTYLNSTTFPAAYYAMRHNLGYPEGKCTGWFLPSIGQWYKAFLALGQMPTNTFDVSGSNDQVAGSISILSNMNTALGKLGTAGTDYTAIKYNTTGTTQLRYWSSSEHTDVRAEDWGWLPNYSPPGLNIGSDPSNKTWYQYVRPFLAF